MLPNKPYIGDQIPNQPFYAPEVPATFDRLFGARVANEQLDPNPTPPAEGWQRPADWLPLPNVSGTEQKFVGLLAIYDCESNFAALQFNGTGTYRVDWGDGFSEVVALGSKAQHSYNFDKVRPSTTTSQGYRQVIVTVTPVSGNLESADLSVGHDNQNLASDGSLPLGHFWLDLSVSVPYAASGQSIVFFNPENPYRGSFGTLEKVTIVNAGGTTNMPYLFSYFAGSLKEFTLESAPNLEDCSNMFSNCSSVQTVSIKGVPMLYDLSYMFGGAYSLKTVEIEDLNSADFFEGIFAGCRSLESVRMTGMNTADSSLYELISSYGNTSNSKIKSIALEDLSSLTSLSDNFSGWTNLRGSVKLTGLTSLTSLDNGFENNDSLERVELSGLENVTSAEQAFYWCRGLKGVVLKGTENIENMRRMFYNCSSLEKAPLFDTSGATDMYAMFEFCNSLSSAPMYDTANVEFMGETFFGCYSLGTIPPLETGSVTDFNSTFYYCYNLVSLPEINTSSVEDAREGFAYCYNLKTLPALDFGSCVDFDGFVQDSATALSCAPFQNVSADISFSNCCLSRNAILDILNGLAPASATIDVSYNYGAADLTAEDLAIAEDKGWTVTY